MAIDQETKSIVLNNRYILGMSAFSIAVIFNLVAFIALITSGIIRQSTGLYLLFLLLADTFYITTTVLMDEFYNPLIGIDVFQESGDALRLCQAIYFLREMLYYWRWILLFVLVVDRVLYASGVEIRRLRIGAVVCSLVSLLVAGGLAGYWAYWVKEVLFKDVHNGMTSDNYVYSSCKFTLAPAADKDSAWFFMEAIVHILFPDALMGILIFIFSVILLGRLRSKAGESLDADDFNFTKAIIALAFVNLLLQVPYLLVNCIFLYVKYKWEPYDFSEKIWDNLTYTGLITFRLRDFETCITFFILLFARMFRSAFCKN